MRRALWPPHIRIHPAPGEGVFLFCEGRNLFLADPGLAEIAPLLDGTRTDEEVIDALEGRLEPAYVYLRLHQLRLQGRLWDTLPFSRLQNSPGLGAWFSSLGMREESAARSLRLATVRVQALEGVSREGLGERLQQLGIRLVERNADLTVVLTEDYLRPELFELDHPRWLPVKPVGHQLWIGPEISGAGPCWECLAHRLRLSRRGQAYAALQRGDHEPYCSSVSWLPSTVQAALELAATEVLKSLLGKGLGAQLWVLDLETREAALHRVVRRPQCPRCGVPPRSSPVQLQASPRPAGHSHSGDPEETYARLRHHVSPLTGLISRLTVPPASDEPVQVVCTWQNLPIRAPSVAWLRNTTNMMGMGKGRTYAQARLSAIAEALERHCGVYQGYETARTASFVELGDQAVHPNRLMLFSERQYAERERTNPTSDPSSFVPLPFDESASVAWSPVWSLTAKRSLYLPSAQAYFIGEQTPADHALDSCCPDSNGCAAGNTLEEALLQGLYELLERDSIALWYYPMARRPQVELEAFGLGHVRRHYEERHQRELWVLDVTTDLGVPSCVAVSRRVAGGPETIVMGFGAHLDPARAVRGAVSELAQVLVFFAANTQAAQCMMHNARRWFDEATLANQPYLGPHGQSSLNARPVFSSPDAREEFEFLQHRLEGRGFEVLALDQTRPDVELRVARVMVPGLRHFWPRFGPGRLYAGGLTEEQLNPLPIFL